MIIDNHFHRIISNFGYRLRALTDSDLDSIRNSCDVYLGDLGEDLKYLYTYEVAWISDEGVSKEVKHILSQFLESRLHFGSFI